MTAKTITLTGAETRAVYSGGSNAWLRNDGADVIYAAAVPGITAGADGVVSIPVGQAAAIYGACGSVYLLGTGSVQLVGSDYTACPFKTSAQSGGSGADSVARAAINQHAGNADIHVTAEEKSGWNGLSNANLLINPDFAINQRGQSTYTGISAYTYTVDRWCIWKYNCDNYGTITVNNDGSLAVDGTMGADDAILTQTMEYGAALVGKTVTLSLEVSEITGTISIQQHKNVQSTLNISAPGVHKITFDWDNSSNRIVINNTNCTHYTVKWIKLELGGAATPFAPPDPAAELLRCQRYFTIYKHQNATSSTDKCTIGVGYALTSSIVYAVLPIAAMRSGVTATISHSGLSLSSGADTVVDYTSVTALEQTDSTVQVAFTVSGQTPGSVYRLRLMNSDAYLAVSKEL